MAVKKTKTQKPTTRKRISRMSTPSSSSSSREDAQEKRMEELNRTDSEDENSKGVVEKNNSSEEIVEEKEEDQGQELEVDVNNKDRAPATPLERVDEEQKDNDDDFEDAVKSAPKKRLKRYHPHLNTPNSEGRSSHYLWSKENELKLLNILIKFKRKNGSFKGANEYVKKKFKNAFTVQQIEYKIKRVRKKYKAYKSKVGNLDSYQKDLYDLCKLIWDENVGREDIKEEGIPFDLGFDLDCYVNEISKDNGVGLDKNVMKDGFNDIETSKRQKLKEKWFQIRKGGLELSIQRLALLAEHLRYMCEAYGSTI